MKSKSLFSVYTILGILGAITTQALPVVYAEYGLTSNQIYNLISIVFLATAFQPIIGVIIDKFFSQERGISILFAMVGVIGIGLVVITTYPYILYAILLSSIFRLPLFAIMDGYSAGLVQKYNLNMALVRAGSTVGFGLGMASLMIFLKVFDLSANYTFLYMTILAVVAVVIIETSTFRSRREAESTEVSEQRVQDEVETTTKWNVVFPLIAMQIMFFGFSILKINYTTPYLVEYGYSNQMIATTTIVGMIPIFLLMPTFGKIFHKFKLTTIISVGILMNITQTGLLLLFPTNIMIVYIGSFLNGFIFPLYTPVFGILLRKALGSKVVSTGFTTIFTIQNLFVFFFNQFVIISLLNVTGTVATAFEVCLGFYCLSLIPVAILRVKKY